MDLTIFRNTNGASSNYEKTIINIFYNGIYLYRTSNKYLFAQGDLVWLKKPKRAFLKRA